MPNCQRMNQQNDVLSLNIGNMHREALLRSACFNKDLAFSQAERFDLGLLGRLPYAVQSLNQQTEVCYAQYLEQSTCLEKSTYLHKLYHTNQTLFYAVLGNHLEEMLPIIYTPTVGDLVKQSTCFFSYPKGLYIAYPDRDRIAQIIDNYYPNSNIDIIVMTDGEGVLGIGDQGIGGMEICVAKSMVYVLCGGIHPQRILPIQLDVGTNNPALLDNSSYLGWRHPRVTGQEYEEFISQVVACIKHKFPYGYLHWEDFGVKNARRNFESHRKDLCSFNDDIQGTGAVTLAALLAAAKICGSTLGEQRVVILGPGTAGTGIADYVCAAMQRQGLSLEEARARIWLVGRYGLLTDDMPTLLPFQRPYARSMAEEVIAHSHQSNRLDLLSVVTAVKPTVLIGCSGHGGAFTKEIISEMAREVDRPVIFPLSNPNEQSEATPSDLLHWTEGRALIATGSPFGIVDYKGTQWHITQCNNALVFPGIGLGIVTAKAKYLSDNMIWKACVSLCDFNASLSCGTAEGLLLPGLALIQAVSKKIALAVALEARRENLAQVPSDVSFEALIEETFWKPHYLPYYEESSSGTHGT